MGPYKHHVNGVKYAKTLKILQKESILKILKRKGSINRDHIGKKV